MSGHYFYGAPRKAGPGRAVKPSRPNERRGQPATGRIVHLQVGQGHGYIRLADERQIYFHRADLSEGTSFNALQRGDAVKFELLEDTVSGARALRVEPHKRSR